MPTCDIVTNVIFGAKKKAKIEGTDKEFTYDGNQHRIDEDVRVSWGEYDISEDLRNQYEVIYSGINGTDYNSKVAPTDAGTYKCTVKISDDNTDYECDPITLTLTIKKTAMKTPDTPTAAGIGANTITLNPPTTFTDGTQIPKLCGFEYRLGDGGMAGFCSVCGTASGHGLSFLCESEGRTEYRGIRSERSTGCADEDGI